MDVPTPASDAEGRELRRGCGCLIAVFLLLAGGLVGLQWYWVQISR